MLYTGAIEPILQTVHMFLNNIRITNQLNFKRISRTSIGSNTLKVVFVEHHTHFNVYVSQRSQFNLRIRITLFI